MQLAIAKLHLVQESKRLEAPETGTQGKAKVPAREELRGGSFCAVSLLRESQGEKLVFYVR